MGFFLRVRPDAVRTITVEGNTFEGVAVTDPGLPEFQGRWFAGATIHASDDEAARLEATGLFERIDDSFAGVRIRERSPPPPGVDLSNDRILGIVGDAPPSTLAVGRTEADVMLHRLAALLKTSGLEEEVVPGATAGRPAAGGFRGR